MGKDNQELNSKRYKRIFKNHKFYIVVTDNEEGEPYAIQAKVSNQDFNRDDHLASLTDWAFRGATMMLRAYGAKKTITDLHNCGMGNLTLPAIIADVLREHCGIIE